MAQSPANSLRIFFQPAGTDVLWLFTGYPTPDADTFFSLTTDKWTLIPYPSTSGGTNPIIVSGPSYSIMVSSAEEQLASWLFIRWLILPENQAKLAQASATLPLSHTAIQALRPFGSRYPQWAPVLDWIENAEAAPSDPDWRKERVILSDAAWQSLQPNIEPTQIPTLLQQLDDMIKEVLNRKS